MGLAFLSHILNLLFLQILHLLELAPTLLLSLEEFGIFGVNQLPDHVPEPLYLDSVGVPLTAQVSFYGSDATDVLVDYLGVSYQLGLECCHLLMVGRPEVADLQVEHAFVGFLCLAELGPLVPL